MIEFAQNSFPQPTIGGSAMHESHTHCHLHPEGHEHTDDSSAGTRIVDIKKEARIYGIASLVQGAIVAAQQAVLIIYSKSLTLLGDTIHASSDLVAIYIGSLFVALLALRCSTAQELSVRKIFAYAGIALLVGGAFYVLVEAHERMSAPVYNQSWLVLMIAIIGGAGNVWIHRLLEKIPNKEHNHTHATFSLHVISDMLLSAAVAISWIATFAFGWAHADPILSVAVAGYMLFLSGTLFTKVQNGIHAPEHKPH